MSQNFTTEMLNDDGIRSALELLQEQVSRYEHDSKRKSFITGESNTSHLTPVYYIQQFKALARKLKTRQYNLQLASLILMLHLPETTQQLLVKNAEMQFRLLRDSTPETLNVGQLEKLIKEVEAIAGTVGAG